MENKIRKSEVSTVFRIGQKFGNRFGTRINIVEVDGLYLHVECYNVNNTADKTEVCYVNKLLEEHLIEYDFEEIK